MLGRELGAPIDLIYEMLISIKTILGNKWSWELKERIEICLKKATQNANEVML